MKCWSFIKNNQGKFRLIPLKEEMVARGLTQDKSNIACFLRKVFTGTVCAESEEDAENIVINKYRIKR